MKTISIQAQREGYRRYGHVWSRRAQLADICGDDEAATPSHVRLSEAQAKDLEWYASTPGAILLVSEPNEVDAALAAQLAEIERLRGEAGKMLANIDALRAKRAELEAEIGALQARREEIERSLAEGEDRAARAEQAARQAEERIEKAKATEAAIEESRRTRRK